MLYEKIDLVLNNLRSFMKIFTLILALVFSFSVLAKNQTNCPCQAEVEKLCPDAKTFDAHKQCLESNKDKLSKECLEAMPNCLEKKDCPYLKKGAKGKKAKEDCGKQCPMKKKLEEEAKKE